MTPELPEECAKEPDVARNISVTSWWVLWLPPNKRRNGIMYHLIFLRLAVSARIHCNSFAIWSKYFNVFSFSSKLKHVYVCQEMKLLSFEKWNCCLLLTTTAVHFQPLVSWFESGSVQGKVGAIWSSERCSHPRRIFFKDLSNPNHFDTIKWYSILGMFWSRGLVILWLSMRMK